MAALSIEETARAAETLEDLYHRMEEEGSGYTFSQAVKPDKGYNSYTEDGFHIDGEKADRVLEMESEFEDWRDSFRTLPSLSDLGYRRFRERAPEDLEELRDMKLQRRELIRGGLDGRDAVERWGKRLGKTGMGGGFSLAIWDGLKSELSFIGGLGVVSGYGVNEAANRYGDGIDEALDEKIDEAVDIETGKWVVNHYGDLPVVVTHQLPEQTLEQPELFYEHSEFVRTNLKTPIPYVDR